MICAEKPQIDRKSQTTQQPYLRKYAESVKHFSRESDNKCYVNAYQNATQNQSQFRPIIAQKQKVFNTNIAALDGSGPQLRASQKTSNPKTAVANKLRSGPEARTLDRSQLKAVNCDYAANASTTNLARSADHARQLLMRLR